MNTKLVPIIVAGVKLVPKEQPDKRCDGCALRGTRQPCYATPCVEGETYIVYVEEAHVQQTQ